MRARALSASTKQKLIDLLGKMCGPEQFLGEDDPEEQLKCVESHTASRPRLSFSAWCGRSQSTHAHARRGGGAPTCGECASKARPIHVSSPADARAAAREEGWAEQQPLVQISKRCLQRLWNVLQWRDRRRSKESRPRAAARADHGAGARLQLHCRVGRVRVRWVEGAETCGELGPRLLVGRSRSSRSRDVWWRRQCVCCHAPTSVLRPAPVALHAVARARAGTYGLPASAAAVKSGFPAMADGGARGSLAPAAPAATCCKSGQLFRFSVGWHGRRRRQVRAHRAAPIAASP